MRVLCVFEVHLWLPDSCVANPLMFMWPFRGGGGALCSRLLSPTECFDGDLKHLCSDKGVCAYDTDAQRARCFCYPGNTGEYCSEGPCLLSPVPCQLSPAVPCAALRYPVVKDADKLC